MNLKLLPASPALSAGRRDPLSRDYAKLRQCKLGEWCWVAAVSRPGICARLARIASRIKAPCGGDVYRINELVRVAEESQRAAVLKYASSSHPRNTLGRGSRVNKALRDSGGGIRCGPMPLVGDQLTGCCFRGPVDRREVPIRLCDWTYVGDLKGPTPYFATDVQVRQEISGGQSGRRSLRAQ